MSVNAESLWYEQYIGRPWEAAPKPPLSFNCGELLCYVHKVHLLIETPEISANPLKLRECVDNMRPEIFGLRALTTDDKVQDYDCAFFSRAFYEDHCGLAVETLDGLLVLHSVQGIGVVLESEHEALSRGFRQLTWYRHVGLK